MLESRIDKVRKEIKNNSITEVSKKLGLTVLQLERYIYGTIKIPKNILDKICTVLKIN